MRHWPSLVVALLLMSACSPQPIAVQPVVSPSPSAAAPETTPSPSMTPMPTPTPLMTMSPSASPTASMSLSPSPSMSPAQLRDLGEANHGDEPFPSAPSGNAYDLRNLTVTAGSGNVSAYGAIDGKPYTEWSARQGVADETWITVDLGSERKVSRVDLLPDASPTVSCFFNVDVSKDGKTWETVGSGKATGSNETPEWGSAAFTGQTVRYVRVAPTSWGKSWVAVWELRIVP